VTAVGLAVLALTSDHTSAAALIAVESAVIAISAGLICASIRLEHLHSRKGIFLATAAGALFGTSDIAIKHLVHPALTHVLLLVNPWTLSALIAMVVAFYAAARSLQLGPAIAVIVFTSLTGNIVALLGGILVFHDPIGHTPPQIAARIAAFCLVILGAARCSPDATAPTHPPRPTRRRGSPTRRSQSRSGPRPEASRGLQGAIVDAHQPTPKRHRSVVTEGRRRVRRGDRSAWRGPQDGLPGDR
jgi:hypothetical protein